MALRLVVHPILAVERDKSGKLNGPPAEAGKNKDETRESFIHIMSRGRRAGRRAESCKGWSRSWPRSGAALPTGGR